MITLTENAVAAMKTALSGGAEPAQGVRITVEPGGCAGLKYLMGLEGGPREGDAIIETDGVRLFVDVGSQPHVNGMTVDFVMGLESSGFIFDNPNAAEKCACGKSFT
ncbi:iron-sulfur cluster assembly accessory protein [Rhizobium jaguaris]|uniref:Iron-sulfur cluster assembly accessory protein n=1 Tax=Rhizobium jaguaris TaxID=1312183 RepID=A0A387G8Y0_9HYPH|nr:iron-sulfur cluster assembly accessory protein [Rhizobium jaguaris]AYG64291.1 iron-sulfur cluster assembly accessory protein [Rhizobium jaguaris]